GGIGFINTSEDIDNVVRRLSMIDINTFKRPFPCFSLAVYLAHMNLDPNSLTLSQNNTLMAGNTAIPMDRQNQTLIDFWGSAATYSTYSYVDILEGKIPAEKLAGKIMLVGPTSAAERDVKYTPFTRGNMVLSGALPVPGVEVHASAIGTYLTNGYFNRAPSVVNLAILLGIGLLSGLAVYRANNPWQGLLYILVLTAAVSALAYLSWNYQHYWINLVSPIALTALIYTAATTENLVTTELERRRTRAAFARYVSPDVVSELLQNKEGISLGGARMNLTILFSDIRGFTTFSEHKEPEYIVHRLNEYFTEMTSVIFKHGGTLDKFLGDGIMAFYGAPIQCEDHADRALKTATEMMERLAVLNQRWKDQGEPTIDIGVGINTGPVVVGNVGSSERMDYTIIGEDVNLAARLESMNKEYRTKILLSDRTIKYIVDPQLKEKTEYLASANVRGMAEPVGIYTIKGFRNKTGEDDNK
ncbi:MAG: adenylate/guanylate cyclase domain-containing protein, partial [Peptococcaceae bacterium]|nr:adenylate/guanylate cyclase domain-containing protein [Peptococcaceae bacterium]